MAVNSTHKSYDKYASQIKLVRDIIDGDTAIKNTKYIPKLPKQTQPEYDSMVARPSYDGFVMRVLDGYTGLSFSKSPTYDVPSKLETLMQDLDLNDSNDVDMAQTIVNEIFITSRVGVLVDYSNGGISEPVNGAVAEQYLRPYMKIYTNESIINWKIKNNQTSLVVLSEMVDIDINEYEVETVEEFLVLALDEAGYYFTRRYRLDKDKKEVLVQAPIYITQNNQKMRYIPFWCATPMKLDIEPSKPPLYDMASCNLSHIKLKTDLYHALWFTIPTPYGSGISNHKDAITIGASEFQLFDHPQAKLQYLEFTGAGLAPIKEELETIKRTIGQLGAEFLRETSNSQESTDTVAMRTAGDRATLISVIDTASRLMTVALKEMARWLNVDSESVSYKINTDYSLTEMNPQMITAITAMHQTGIYSDYDMFTALKKGEMIDETLTFSDWMDYRESSSVNNPMVTNENKA